MNGGCGLGDVLDKAVLLPVHPNIGMLAMMPHQGHANAFGNLAINEVKGNRFRLAR